MSYVLHGSSSHTGMGWLDSVPVCPRLHIGGLYALYQTELVRAAEISHVLSVIDYDPLLQEKFPWLKHFHIKVEDDPNENLLQYFTSTNRFIDEALENPTGKHQHDEPGINATGGTQYDGRDGKKLQKDPRGPGVFVHCAMGKSRSAAIVIAYLMWKYALPWETALEKLCEGRPVCDPNPGFKEQLAVYERMLRIKNPDEAKRSYDDWLNSRFTGEWWEWEARGKRGGVKSRI